MTNERLILKDVRISYPYLFKKAVYMGVVGKYEAGFIIPKSDIAQKAKIDSMIKACMSKNGIKTIKESCISDGDVSDKPELENCWILKAKSTNKPTVFDKNRVQCSEDKNPIYGGCRVDVSVDFYPQKDGKAIRANLHAVRFRRDDEPFGSAPISSSELVNDFEDIKESELEDLEDVL
jgi:hypothetical protein